MTILICLVKGTLAGMVPAFAYNALKKFNPLVASITAAVIAPVVNTGIFALGCMIIRKDVIAVASRLDLEGINFMSLLFGVIITTNFFIELVINVIFAPALDKVAGVVTKKVRRR
jgi:hypothetical protein